jgi:hypothetical protein
MKIALTSNAKAFGKNLTEYAGVSSRGFSGALASEGSDFAQEMFRQFRKIRPAAGSIFNAAEARGFSLSRRNSTKLVPTVGNLSQRAVNKAKALLGGQSSALFKKGFDHRIEPVVFSSQKSHRMVHLRQLYRGSGLLAFHLPGTIVDKVISKYRQNNQRYEQFTGNKLMSRMNLRALATYFELLYRSRATGGGTMAVQWLHKTWRKGAWPNGSNALGYMASPANVPRPPQLVVRSSGGKGIPIGTVDFEFSGNVLNAIVFKGYVPGTGEESSKRGILDTVFGLRANKLMGAIAASHAKAARMHGLN